MVSIESHSHAFVVKIWLEEEPDDEQPGLWRGYIFDVEERQRHYLSSLADVPAFLAPYLAAWGLDDLNHWHPGNPQEA